MHFLNYQLTFHGICINYLGSSTIVYWFGVGNQDEIFL